MSFMHFTHVTYTDPEEETMSGPTWGLHIQGYSSPSPAQERLFKKRYPAEWAAHQDTLEQQAREERRKSDTMRAKAKTATLTLYSENTKPILEALARGDVIQINGQHGWVDVDWDDVIKALGNHRPSDSFRVKPNILVITIGDVTNEVPGPYRGEMEDGQTFYVPSPATTNRFIGETWGDDSWDFDVQNAGLVHLSQENAILHARALRGEKL